MNSPRLSLTHCAIARGIQILALAGGLLAGASLGRSVAHAGGSTFCATHHYLTNTSAQESVLKVGGSCFPFPSSVHIAIRDATTGAVLRSWITVPVTMLFPANPIPGFQYVTQGDARPGDTIRFWLVDGPWHRILTVTDTP
jgi:hypothetical protein